MRGPRPCTADAVPPPPAYDATTRFGSRTSGLRRARTLPATRSWARASRVPIETRPSCARSSAQSGPGPEAWRRVCPPGATLVSILHELVGDGPAEQPPRGANRRPDVRPGIVCPAETVHLTESRHRLLRPAVHVAPFIGHAEEIPDDFFEMIRIGDRDDPHPAALEYPIDFRRRLQCRRRVLQNLDHEDAIERRVGKRQPCRDVLGQDVGPGVLGRDIEPLILDSLRQEFAAVALPAGDIGRRMARPPLRAALREPLAAAFLTPVSPPGAVAIEGGQH